MSLHQQIPMMIDVDAELAHWRALHASGQLSGASFGHYVPWVKFACDTLLSQPRADLNQREALFRDHFDQQIMPRLTQQQARAFVQQCWDRMCNTERDDPPHRQRA